MENMYNSKVNSSNKADTVKVKKIKYQDVNVLSKLFFFWIIPTFKKGFKHDLTEEDLVDIGKNMDARLLGDKFEDAWLHELSYRKTPYLWRAFFVVIRKDLLVSGILFALTEVARLCQPIFLGKYLEHFNPQSVSTKAETYKYATYLIISIFFTTIFNHLTILQFMFFGLKLKVAADSLIYRRVLQLSKSSLAETSLGKIVNLLSSDAYRLHNSLTYVHLAWLAPLEVGIIAYLTYYYFGLCAIIGSVVFILLMPCQAWIGTLMYRTRLKLASKTDSRLKLMNDIILGIKVIKMYTWAKPFAKLMSRERKQEVKQLLRLYQFKSILLSLNTWLSRMAIYLAVVSNVALGGVATAQFIFTLTCFYDILRVQVANAFTQAVAGAAETALAANRLTNFLRCHESEKYPKPKIVRMEETDFNEKGVWINNATAKWNSHILDPSLSKINFEVAGPHLVAIVGPVGCGKTTLLHLILKELLPIDGSVAVNGKLSYASQNPWLFDATIRDNIIFGHVFNDAKYQHVIHVCALDRDLSILPYGDETLVGERGIMLSGGQKARINLARAVYAEADIYLLDDPLSAVDAGVANHIFTQCICKYLKNKCVIVVMHQLQYLENVDRVCFMKDGSFTALGDLETILGNDIHIKEYKQIDYSSKPQSPLDNKEHMASGAVSSNVYAVYVKATGMTLSIAILVHFIGLQALASFTDYYLSIWANFSQWKQVSNSTHQEEPNWPSFITNFKSPVLYSSLIVPVMILSIIRNVSFFKACLRASMRLYNRLFEKLCDADMLFYFRNSSGRILNRLSWDIRNMDEVVPFMMFFTLQVGVSIIGVVSVTAVLHIWLVVPSLILFALFYILRSVFLRTCTGLKRLEAITKSHTSAHLTTTLQGLTTIRGFEAQETAMKTFDTYENLNTSSFFMCLCASRAFGAWMDLLCTLHISILILTLIFFKETSGGIAGLVVTQSMTLLTLFQWGIKQWAELDTQMISVERVKEYIDIQPEKDENVEEPQHDWPEKGVLEFRNVSLRYSIENPYVIKNISFLIKSKEKVGIVGRTGAGKSSLINALFRLLKIDGQILIDNVDITKISLDKVRSSISIIPQDPVMFAGSIRNNLDPFSEYKDEVLWKALEDVNLKPLVTQMGSGLDSCMSEGGANFSIGQRQLLCLARALLRKNRILVLDEATANVDMQTDTLIQSAIRTKFSHCTVLVVAHRLQTIMDSHRIMVMDEGALREFDHPYVLLQNEVGIFKELVDQMGPGMAEHLESIAKQNFLGLNAVE